jgi:hypothetical protein
MHVNERGAVLLHVPSEGSERVPRPYGVCAEGDTAEAPSSRKLCIRTEKLCNFVPFLGEEGAISFKREVLATVARLVLVVNLQNLHPAAA